MSNIAEIIVGRPCDSNVLLPFPTFSRLHLRASTYLFYFHAPCLDVLIFVQFPLIFVPVSSLSVPPREASCALGTPLINLLPLALLLCENFKSKVIQWICVQKNIKCATNANQILVYPC